MNSSILVSKDFHLNKELFNLSPLKHVWCGFKRRYVTFAGCRVIDGDDAVRLEFVVLAGEHQRGGQVDDVARGEVLPGGVVGAFRELADQLLKNDAHTEVADALRAEVD